MKKLSETERQKHRYESQEKYKKKYPDRRKETARKYRQNTKISKRLNRILQAAKTRAKQQNYEFNLTLKDIVIPDRCPVLNIPLMLSGSHDNRPSLDRLDNTKGYTKTNVHVISMRANRLKSDASLDELERLAAYIRKNK